MSSILFAFFINFWMFSNVPSDQTRTPKVVSEAAAKETVFKPLEDFRKKYGSLKSFRVKVKKTVKLTMMETSRVQSGYFYRKGQSFLWDLSEPFMQKISYDGRKLVSLTQQNDKYQAIEFLNAAETLKKQVLFQLFDLSRPLNKIFKSEIRSANQVALIDSQGNQYLLTFKGKLLASIQFQEDGINETTFELSEYRKNYQLQDNFFTIGIPKDAEIIRQD